MPFISQQFICVDELLETPRQHDKEDVMSPKNKPTPGDLFFEDQANGELFSPYLAKNEKVMQSIYAALTKGASKPDDVRALANPRFWIFARAGGVRLISSGTIDDIVDPIFRISDGQHSIRFGIGHAGCDDQRNLRLTALVMMALALIDDKLKRMNNAVLDGNLTSEVPCTLLRREIKDLILSLHHQMYEVAVDGLWTREAWQQAFQDLQASRSQAVT
ncbi:hypothetical protein [Pseudorhizobium pelagicum]|uniref:Uncharacterized protein n=1 Tax=Pseudorhizobium pelagicum TaxID=1509405 RepID=A0A922NYX5_9HYPH|nr:hypothetical protein [Pseudorhizobium pelagicum]KEQ04289.1 hypothetical protein GV68_13685 [Pseudorhizobium pelagicum]